MRTTQPVPSPDPERDVPDGVATEPPKRYVLHNRTQEQIRIVGDPDGELRLAPLAERVVRADRLAPFRPCLQRLCQRHQLRIRAYAESSRSTGLEVALWGALVALVLVTIGDILVYGTLIRPEAGAAAAVAVAVTAVALVVARGREHRRRRAEEVADAAEGDIAFGVGGAYYDGNETVRRTKHALTLVAVIVIGAVLPAIAIVVATDATQFVVMEGGFRVVDGMESRFVSRVIQIIYTAVLSLFPAMMYFQFDRQRVGTIRGRWVRSIFRMDRRMRTLADVNARYGDDLAEASSYSTDSVRFLGGRSSPIIVATILISLGWTLLVVRTESYDFAGATQVTVASEVAADAAERAAEAADADGGSDTATAAADAAAEAGNEAAEATARSTGEPVPTTTESTDEGGVSATESAEDAAASAEEAAAAKDEVALPFFQLLVPTPSAATMAFLGAYFFGVYLVLGGYFRGDLRPKIYNQITARLVTVVVVAYLINALLWDPGQSNRVLLAAAFLAGVVPNTVLQRLGIFATGTVFGISTGARSGSSPRPKGWLRRSFADAFGAPRALTQIDGIDIYESARLASEGVADVPSLARSDLVPMMINTRLPVERLVDWTDQAVLVALLDGGPDETPDRRVVKLRSMGIRTASDLRAVDGADEMDGTRRDVERILSEGGPEGGRDGEALLRWLADRIVAEPSFHRIQRWRASELADIDEDCPTLTVRAGDCDEIPGDGDRREAPGDGEDAGKNGTKRVRRGPNGARRPRPKPPRPTASG